MINSKKVMAAAPVAACKKTTTEKDGENRCRKKESAQEHAPEDILILSHNVSILVKTDHLISGIKGCRSIRFGRRHTGTRLILMVSR